MRDDLRRDLTAALKNRNQVAVTALRSALAAIENAEAQPVDDADHQHEAVDDGPIAGAAVGVGAAEADRRHLTEADVHTIVAREADERSTSANQYERLSRDDVAGRLRAEADVLSRYLDARH